MSDFRQFYRPRSAGFTLAELLIALVILGVIATFTIPKVLTAQQDTRFRAIGKEVAGMVSGAHQARKLQGTLVGSSTRESFTPFFNYVRVDTSASVDDKQTLNTLNCSTRICLILHNGAVLHFGASNVSFGNTQSTNAIAFFLDPDGKVTDGTTNGPGKSVTFSLYYDGKLRTEGTKEPNSCDSNGCGGPVPDPTLDPPWFGWD